MPEFRGLKLDILLNEELLFCIKGLKLVGEEPKYGLLIPLRLGFFKVSSFFLSETNFFISNNCTFCNSLRGNSALPKFTPQSILKSGVSFVLKGFLRHLIIIASNNFNFCKSDTVTSGVEAVLSFSLDFTSPHILLISSRAFNSVDIKYIKFPQLPLIT